jgi:hypothetical protein
MGGSHGTGGTAFIPSRPNKSRLLKPPFLQSLTCFYALFTRLLLFLINRKINSVGTASRVPRVTLALACSEGLYTLSHPIASSLIHI